MDSIESDGTSSAGLAKSYLGRFRLHIHQLPNWYPSKVIGKFNYKRPFAAWTAKQKQLIGVTSFQEDVIPGNYQIDGEKKTRFDSLFRRTLGRFSKRTSYFILI